MPRCTDVEPAVTEAREWGLFGEMPDTVQEALATVAIKGRKQARVGAREDLAAHDE